VPPRSWREARAQDLQWAREYAWPWVVRRIKHVSSGDGLPPKRPLLAPLVPLVEPEHATDDAG
jgi:hypothetical protein